MSKSYESFDELNELIAYKSMPKSYESLNELIEDSAKTAKEIVARSQEQRHIDEQSWRCGYDYLTEGGLGDY